jgi:hypothetical protein
VLVYFNPALARNPEQSLMNPNSLLPLAIVSAALTVWLILIMKKNSSVSYAEVYRDDKPSEIDKFSF